MTKFPSEIDTDMELPKADDNVTEITSSIINAIREAVIAIERTIGENPQGSTATLVARLAESINDDGTLKAAALAAAGLVVLPISNDQVGASAAIEESKLDLDYSTAVLRTDINSNDVDIAALQKALADLLYRFGVHINGIGLKHDSFDILLDSAYQTSTPPAFISITSSDVGSMLIEINNRFLDHASVTKIGAHKAINISVDDDFETFSANEVQGALHGLDQARSNEFIVHRDDLHANGFVANASDLDGYSSGMQVLPSTVGTNASATILSGAARNIIDFGVDLTTFPISQGDVVAIYGDVSPGFFIINDVGPRISLGTKAALTNNQLEITGTFTDDGAVLARIFTKSSVFLLKGNVAPTVYQADSKTDSIQLSRPNAARVVSLGIQPRFIDSTHTLNIEVGVAAGLVRTISITNLHFDRTASPASVVTVDTIVERINYVLQNGTLGNVFPAAAYRVGEEIQIAHNWVDTFATLRILSTGTGNFFLGFDEFGANVLDRYFRPTERAYFYVAGKQHQDFALIAQDTASVAGQVFTFDAIDPLVAGVKIGHLIHMKSHANTAEIGTYFIVDVTSTTVTVQLTGSITAQLSVDVEIYHDAAPLDEYNTATKDLILEVFLTSTATVGVNERLRYDDTIANLSVIDVSDNFIAATNTLTSAVANGILSLTLGTSAKAVLRPDTFIGQVEVFGPSNVSSITVDLVGPLGNASTSVVVSDHIDEEEVLEVCSVRLNGLLTASKIVDKRLFGTLGLQELREDVTQAYVETPIRELRSNGVVFGFDIIDGNYQDPAFPVSPATFGLLLRGGVAYVGGVRCDVPTLSVIFPNIAGTYTVALDSLGVYQIIDTADYSLTQVLDGYLGELLPVAKVVHNGTSVTSAEDLRFFIGDIDQKLEILLDETNHFIGNVSSSEAAVNLINNWPTNEKFKIKVISYTASDLDLSNVTKDVTIQIDGQVQSITVAPKCKITAESPNSRTVPHVIGAITVPTTCTDLEISNLKLRGVAITATSSSHIVLDNVQVDGQDYAQVSLTGAGLGSFVCRNSKFLDGFGGFNFSAGFSFGDVVVTNCSFIGNADNPTAVIGGAQTIISGCIFDGIGVRYTATAGSAIINGCVFRNIETLTTDTVRVLAVASNTKVVGSFFDSITVTDISAIFSAANVQLDLADCQFSNSTIDVNKLLIETTGDVINSIFDTITFAASEAIQCNKFKGNSLIDPVNASLVLCESFEDNKDFHAVASTSATKLKLVANNKFLENSVFGYTIDGSQVGGDDDGMVVTGNNFTTSSIAISLGTNPIAVTIANNIFAGLGTAIDFGTTAGTSLGIVVSGNIMNTADPFSSGAAVSGVLITGNRLACNAGSITVGDDFHVEGNQWTGLDYSFVTGGNNGFRLSGNSFNVFGGISIGSVTKGIISGNYFDDASSGKLVISGAYTDVVFDGNACVIDVSGASTTDMCVFSDNIGSMSNSTNMTWKNTLIQGNVILESTALVLRMFSDVGGNKANVVFKSNLFTDPVTVTSSNPLHGFVFADNTSLDPADPPITVTFSSNVNEGEITGNFNVNLTFSAGMNASIVSENMMLIGALTLQSSVSSAIISSNYVETMAVECSSTGGLVLSDNFVSGNLDVLNLTTGTLSIAGAVFSGNYVVGDIRVMSATTNAAANLSVTDSFFTNHRCENFRVLGTTNATGATATHTFDNNKILQNTVADTIYVFDANVNLDNSNNFRDNKFGSNDCNDFKLIQSATSNAGGSRSVVENITIENNLIGVTILAEGDWEFDGFYCRGNVIGSGISIQLEHDSIDPTRTYANCSLTNNICGSGIGLTWVVSSATAKVVTFSNFNISGNFIAEDGSGILISRNVTGLDKLQFDNVVISNNITKAIFLLGANTTALTTEYVRYRGLTVSGNFFIPDGVADSGFYITSDTTNSSTFVIENLAFSGNSAKTSVVEPATFTISGDDLISITNMNCSGNINVRLEADGEVTFDETLIGSNQFPLLSLGETTGGNVITITDSIISGNRITSCILYDIAVSDCSFVSNLVDTFNFDNITALSNFVMAQNQFKSTFVFDTDSVSITNLAILGNVMLDAAANITLNNGSSSGTSSSLIFIGNKFNELNIGGASISSVVVQSNIMSDGITIDAGSTSLLEIFVTQNNVNFDVNIESTTTANNVNVLQNIISGDVNLIFGTTSNKIFASQNQMLDLNISCTTFNSGKFEANTLTAFNLTCGSILAVSIVSNISSGNIDIVSSGTVSSMSLLFNSVGDVSVVSTSNVTGNYIGNSMGDVIIRSTSGTATGISFQNNLVSSSLLIRGQTTLSGLKMQGNNFFASSVSLEAVTGAATGNNISNNTFSRSLLSQSLTITSAGDMTSVSVIGNQSTSTGPCVVTISSSTADIETALVSQNQFGNASSSLSITAPGSLIGIGVIDNVVFGNVTLSGVTLISGLFVSDNVLRGTASMTFNNAQSLNNSFICGNSIDVDLDLDTSSYSNGGIVRLFLAFNRVAGAILLPRFLKFDDADEQSKFIGNWAGTWTGVAADPIVTAGAGNERIFPLGNTGSAATDVTFSGTTATNVTTMNNLTGGITC